jgi:uncharacterized protein with HEPN domain
LPTPSTPEADIERWREIIAAGEAIQAWVSGLDESTYLADPRTCAAVAMNLIVIGEAAGRLSAQAKQATALPWPQIAGLRNRIAHGYAVIDHRRVWQVVSVDLEPLLVAARSQLP